ncbi:hypothetical protein TRVA0_077S00320 [Trichomonascus vanleenenianus]|uniref:SUN domain-containing protein n=1 Tax=Trichomonascus vanleenenianus TaxID=2268995 RepID=UPI003ECB5275
MDRYIRQNFSPEPLHSLFHSPLVYTRYTAEAEFLSCSGQARLYLIMLLSLVLLIASAAASPVHHNHGSPVAVNQVSPVAEIDLSRRGGGNCQFPANEGLVAITPNAKNAGWALSPDQECSPGSWCPYACPPGQVSMQWDPSATTYSYPQSQYGGLYCENDGSLSKPFPNKPYCVDGTGAVKVHNKCGGEVAFCQTVLPGNEAMIIPNSISGGSLQTIAVPDPSYWASTAAHYYVNPPGVSVDDGCIWGDDSNSYGNWSPYVAGANTDSQGRTFVKIGWNPIWLGSSLQSTMPTFGLRIVCDGGDCNGLPCSIDPSKQDANEVEGGSNGFCVVTAAKGTTAHIEVFENSSDDSSSGDSSSDDSSTSSSPSSSEALKSTTSSPKASSSAVKTTTHSAVHSTTTTTSPPTTTSSAASFSTADASSTGTSDGTKSSSIPTRSVLNLYAIKGTDYSSSAVPSSTHSVEYMSDLFSSSRTALYNFANSTEAASTVAATHAGTVTKSSAAESATTAAEETNKKNSGSNVNVSLFLATMSMSFIIGALL